AGEWRRFVGEDPHVRQVYQADAYTAYVMESAPAQTPIMGGARLAIGSIAVSTNAPAVGRMIDGDLLTRWDTGHAQRPGDTVVADLGTVVDVAGAELQIGADVSDFPRRLAVETSIDGQTWSGGWSDDVAVTAVSGALDEPRTFPL